MRSSTSSSDSATTLLTAVALVARGLVPIVAIAVVAGALAMGLRSQLGAPPPHGIESVVVGEQLERAKNMADPEVLLIGDSSLLMGVDVAQLEHLLDQHVESLATVGWVGPVGYAHLLDMYAEHHRRMPTVVIVMHGSSLALDEAKFRTTRFEEMVIHERTEVADRGAAHVQRELYETMIQPFVQSPLPGRYAQAYGFAADLAQALRAGHGSLIDPGVLGHAADKPFMFELSPSVERRLHVLAETLQRLHPARVLVAVTPIPESRVGPNTAAQRAAIVQALADTLGATPLALPLSLPSDEFASVTHLAAPGRAIYTPQFAAALARAL